MAAVLLLNVFGARTWLAENLRTRQGTGVADGPAVRRGADGAIMVDGTHLTPYYDGHFVTIGQIRALQKQGKAQTSITDFEFACLGADVYVDSHAQIDEWVASMRPRMIARVARTRAAKAAGDPHPFGTGDPCADAPKTLPAFSHA